MKVGMTDGLNVGLLEVGTTVGTAVTTDIGWPVGPADVGPAVG